MKDTVGQAREFALYLVINREPLSDFNPGSDNDHTCVLKDNVCAEREGRREVGKRWSQEDQLRDFSHRVLEADKSQVRESGGGTAELRVGGGRVRRSGEPFQVRHISGLSAPLSGPWVFLSHLCSTPVSV